MMPRFNNINYKELKKDIQIVFRCPYCGKTFLNKKSYRGHIIKGFCTMCDIKTGKSIEIGIPIELLGGE